MPDNQLLAELLTSKQLLAPYEIYSIFSHAADVYRRTKAVMKSAVVPTSRIATTQAIKINSDAYASSKVYTCQ